MKDWKGLLATVIVTAGVLFLYFWYSIINADTLSLGNGGDAYKNYYTLAYYLRNDTGAHFTGMNYPFGEQVMFTDNQPLLAWILKALTKPFPGIVYHVHGIISWLIFLSVLVSAAFIYKTLRKQAVDVVPAVAFSVLIAALSPQFLRFMGHFSLAYTCVLPMVFYYLVSAFQQKHGNRYPLLIAVTVTLFSFIHLYYLALSGMFIMLVAMLYALVHIRQIKTEWQFPAKLTVSAITPFIILKGFLLLTDHIADRPTAPWGFVATRSTVSDIFIGAYSFTGQLVGDLFPQAPIAHNFEGYGYIGLVASLCFACLVIYTLIQLVRRKGNPIPYPFNYFLPAGIVILLFAMAFPFCIDQFEKYYVLMPGPIKQFRASGRFNWAFYYTITLLTAVFISRLAQSSKHKWAQYALLLIPVTVWAVELNMISVRNARDFKIVSGVSNEIEEERALHENLHRLGKKATDYQAILALPLFLNGSEKLYIESEAAFAAMQSSLYTNLPLIDCEMSRTSQSQAFSIANLTGAPLTKKEVVKLFPNNKPLLMLSVGGNLKPAEWRLMDKAKYLFQYGDRTYFELPLSAFTDVQDSVKQLVATNYNSYYRHGDYMSTDSLHTVFIKNFDTETTPYASFGKGAWYSRRDDAFLFFDTLPNARENTEYEISIWFYADKRRPAFPVIYFTQLDSAGQEIFKRDANGKFSTNTYGDWVRSDFTFTIRNKNEKLFISGNGEFASYDELMIRPVKTDVITHYENAGKFMFNNFPVYPER
jgi:hypothetical protein